MTMLSKKIMISEFISPDLALRLIVDSLFDRIEEFPQKHITIDFSNVTSITRSFAHEYLNRKEKSCKVIDEVNVPVNIQKMFVVVKSKRIATFPELKFDKVVRLGM